MPESRKAFLSGLKAIMPILVGVVPFGMIYGVVAVEAGLTRPQAQSMSFIVFAGSAQFIMAQLFDLQTPSLVIVLTAVLLNLRHALYSASVAPYVTHLRPLWRWVVAYFLTDEAYAVSVIHYRQDSPLSHKHWYFLGSGLGLWITWQLSTAFGIFVGAQIPAGWPLDFFVALTFIALVVPALGDRPSVVSALAAGVAAVLAYNLPLKLGLVLAALTGIAAGLLAENIFGPRNIITEADGPRRGAPT